MKLDLEILPDIFGKLTLGCVGRKVVGGNP